MEIGREVVERSKDFAEVAMGEKCQGAAVRFSSAPQRLGRNQCRRNDGAADQQQAHDERGDLQQFACVPDARLQDLVGCITCPFDVRHHGDPGFETREPERQLGEQNQRGRHHHQRVGFLREQVVAPSRKRGRMLYELHQLVADHDHVQRDVEGDQRYRQPDGFAKSLQKHRAERGQQNQRHDQLVLHPRRHERVVDNVRGGVGSGERHGDDEVRGGKTEQAEHERLAAPARQQIFQHRQAALSVGG
jgi:hypothetical protein